MFETFCKDRQGYVTAKGEFFDQLQELGFTTVNCHNLVKYKIDAVFTERLERELKKRYLITDSSIKEYNEEQKDDEEDDKCMFDLQTQQLMNEVKRLNDIIKQTNLEKERFPAQQAEIVKLDTPRVIKKNFIVPDDEWVEIIGAQKAMQKLCKKIMNETPPESPIRKENTEYTQPQLVTNDTFFDYFLVDRFKK